MRDMTYVSFVGRFTTCEPPQKRIVTVAIRAANTKMTMIRGNRSFAVVLNEGSADSAGPLLHRNKSMTSRVIHPDDAAFVGAFIVPNRKARWHEALASPRLRPRILNRLNHCRDLDSRFVVSGGTSDTVATLRSLGAPESCHVISCADEIDGRDLSLHAAMVATKEHGWGTVLSCITGELAFYFDELGERQWVLRRTR